MRSDLDLVYGHDELADLDAAGRRLEMRRIFVEAGLDDVAERVARASDEIDGFGPISMLMQDPTITDILINGASEVWVERAGGFQPAPCRFDSDEHLWEWCERRVSGAGGRVDSSCPIADVRLEDGARMHVVLPPVAPGGPLVSIRRFPEQALSIDDLVEARTMTAAERSFFEESIASGRSIVISGPTGAGKTTLLNALLALVPSTERVVVIEELPELRVSSPNRVSLVSRPPNAEGRGSVGLDQLVRASLRMRPDRIVIGEVRGAEALPALWAMRTGHAGTMLSVHAADARDAPRRLADLAMMSERARSSESVSADIAAAVDVYVHMQRRDGRRVVAEIASR